MFHLNAEMFQQHGTGPGVLCKNEIRLTENSHGPAGHVLQIADRSRDYIELSSHLLSDFSPDGHHESIDGIRTHVPFRECLLKIDNGLVKR